MASPSSGDDVLADEPRDEQPAQWPRSAQLSFDQPGAGEQVSDPEEQLVDGAGPNGQGQALPPSGETLSTIPPARKMQSIKKLKYNVNPKYDAMAATYTREDAKAFSQRMKVRAREACITLGEL